MPKSGYTDFNTAAHSIVEYINKYYNCYRPHQFNSGQSPQEAEKQYHKTYNEVANFS